jgi:hypothetical protein
VRNALVLVGGIAVACGLAAMLTGAFSPAFVFVFWGGCLVLAVLYERFRYKPIETGAPGPGWNRTAERFVDDETGKTVTVYLEPATGERRYVEE